jgi:hypothetical protein
MRNEIIKLLQGKGFAIANDATDREIISAAASLTSPKVLPDSTPQHSTAPPLAASSDPTMNTTIDPNTDFKNWTKNQCDAFYSQELSDQMARNGGDAFKAGSVVRTMFPKLFTRLEDIRRQILGAQSAASEYPAPAPCVVPSQENMDRFGMTRPTLDEATIAFKANGSVYEPVQAEKIFDALAIKAMRDADISGNEANTRVANRFPKLKNMVDAEKAKAAIGRSQPAPQNPFAVR